MNVSNLGFYIGKTSNKNVAIYSFNIKKTNQIETLDIFEPLSIYWIMREQEGNPREELTTLEKTMADGYDLEQSTESDSIVIRIKALPSEKIYIKSINSKYKCIILISKNGKIKEHYLKKIMLHNSTSFNYSVDQFDIIYEDPDTGKLHTEIRKKPVTGWDTNPDLSELVINNQNN
jgi:hypothetical protein